MSEGAGKRFLPYGRQWLGEEEIEAVVAVLRGDWLTQGPAIERFERRLCEVTGARHAVAVSSGTAALHLAMLALGAGPGDLVAVPPLTFAASANAALYAGARPVFVDVHPGTWCLDPDRLRELLRDPPGEGRPRGVVPVHFAGLPAHAEEIAAIAREHGLFVLEDACHSLGAEWEDAAGRTHRVGDGTTADATVLSFHPVKGITTGEGGAVLTPHAEIAERVRRLRHHGIERDPARFRFPSPGAFYHEMQELGFNYRITDIQCALGTVQLDRLEGFVERRRELAARYHRLLADDPRVTFQEIPPGCRSAWHLLAVEVPSRDRVFAALRERGIGCQVHYLPVHLHPYYRDLGYGPGLCPVAEGHSARTLTLPLFPAMADADVDRVVADLREVLDKAVPGEEDR